VLAIVIAALAAACSSAAPPTGTQQPTPEPRSGGLGRVSDVPSGPCARERGSRPLDPDATPVECRTDAECTAGINGRCLRISNHGSHGPAYEATHCSYDACFADADCEGTQICVCAERAAAEPGTGHVCVGSECASDADCGAGRYCRRSAVGRFCHSPSDECVEETDCGEGRACVEDPSTRIHRCTHVEPPVG
jgi:Cys-rich repeat protein